MKSIVSIIAASALISGGLVGGLAAANRSRATAETATWTNLPSIEAGCRSGCAAATRARKVRVIAIDGRTWRAEYAVREQTVLR